MQSRGQVLSRDNLLEQVWGDGYLDNSKTLEVHIRWLRRKLEPDPSYPEHITTLRGFGYR
jgi:two-component system phosphate regulon response regulator PhoB